MGWAERLLVAEMAANAVIACLWAWGAVWIARQERVRWPVPWRWLVAHWMAWKAAFFVTIAAAMLWRVGLGVVEAVVGGFTVAHAWAFWRWLRMPVGGPRDERTER